MGGGGSPMGFGDRVLLGADASRESRLDPRSGGPCLGEFLICLSTPTERD